MANVIQLSDHRKQAKPKLSVAEVVSWCIDDLIGTWEKFAKTNRLNDFFQQSIQSSTADLNYVQDLNAIASIEAKLGLALQIISPDFSEDSLGWVASFRVNGAFVSTPWMSSEAFARSFAIVLFLKVKAELKTLSSEVTS